MILSKYDVLNEFVQVISELFDKPYDTTFDVEKTRYVKDQIRQRNLPIDTNDLRVHKLEGDNGHVLSYHRDGALEVHHYDKNDFSGKMHKNVTKSNPRFIATMLHHLKDRGLGRGHSVRIVTENSPEGDILHKHYRKIVDKLTKGDNYEVHHKKDVINDKHVNTIEIHHKKTTLQEIMMQAFSSHK